MSRPIIAFDIETAPQPLARLSERQRRRHDLLLEDELRRSPDGDREDLSRKVRSLHPMLGFICCISVLRAGGEPKSYTGRIQNESDILTAFWADLARLPQRVLWVSFNGKRFDADWLRVRSAAHGLTPSRRDILDRYPYNHEPHCDLARVFECRAGLGDLCDLLGVENPKSEMDGGGVAEAVEAGRLADIARYCEADVRATLACYERLSCQL